MQKSVFHVKCSCQSIIQRLNHHSASFSVLFKSVYNVNSRKRVEIFKIYVGSACKIYRTLTGMILELKEYIVPYRDL